MRSWQGQMSINGKVLDPSVITTLSLFPRSFGVIFAIYDYIPMDLSIISIHKSI